jgi:hypothetical protein
MDKFSHVLGGSVATTKESIKLSQTKLRAFQVGHFPTSKPQQNVLHRLMFNDVGLKAMDSNKWT